MTQLHYLLPNFNFEEKLDSTVEDNFVDNPSDTSQQSIY